MNDYTLTKGSHPTAKDGRCAMEWVAYLAGESHTDQPACVSPVLRRFCIALNDRLPDHERQQLRPYLARTIGTAGDGMDEQRLQMCREFLLHHSLPFYLDKAGRHEAAERLRALPADLTVEAVGRAIEFARDEAWTARCEARDRLEMKIRAELAKRGSAVAVAVAAAVAVAVAAAAAVADAVAAADAAAAAVAAADAAAAAAAAAAAVAAAVADAAAVAAAAAAADPAAAADGAYWAVREPVRERVGELARKLVAERTAQMLPATLELLDRMLPTDVIQLPVVEDAEAVCGMALDSRSF